MTSDGPRHLHETKIGQGLEKFFGKSFVDKADSFFERRRQIRDQEASLGPITPDPRALDRQAPLHDFQKRTQILFQMRPPKPSPVDIWIISLTALFPLYFAFLYIFRGFTSRPSRYYQTRPSLLKDIRYILKRFHTHRRRRERIQLLNRFQRST